MHRIPHPWIMFVALYVLAPWTVEARVYVDDSAVGMNDGSSWEDAFVSLQEAIAAASPGEEIWVASGVYRPTLGLDRGATFSLPAGSVLYGGFAGDESSLEERDWVENVTILSGEIGSPEPTDNCYNVVEMVGERLPTTVLDGFEIVGGYANGSLSGDVRGGGVRAHQTTLNLQNLWFHDNWGNGGAGLSVTECTAVVSKVRFSQNRADIHINGSGGGMYASHSVLTLQEAIFEENRATANGGGLYIWVSLSGSSVSNVLFDGNWVDRYGGGMRFTLGPLTVSNITFVDNTARLSGGGFMNDSGELTMTNAVFQHNIADDGAAYDPGGGAMTNSGDAVYANLLITENSAAWGGAIYNTSRDPVFTNVTIWGNEAEMIGGAIMVLGGSVRLTNAILWENQAPANPEIYLDTYASAEISHSIISGSGGSGPQWPESLGTDEGGNLDADPIFKDPGFDFHPQSWSPVVDAGKSNAPGLPEIDLDRKPRIIFSAVDIGAYEVEEFPTESPLIGPPTDRTVAILSAHPNPFTSQLEVEFESGMANRTSVVIYDILGRLVQRWELAGGKGERQRVSWDARDRGGKMTASGVYVVKLIAGDHTDTRRVVRR